MFNIFRFKPALPPCPRCGGPSHFVHAKRDSGKGMLTCYTCSAYSKTINLDNQTEVRELKKQWKQGVFFEGTLYPCECGDRPVFLIDDRGSTTHVAIMCKRCGIRTAWELHYLYDAYAVSRDAWNQRQTVQLPKKEPRPPLGPKAHA